jgi:acetylornithine/succinyldiaminopimelate/putrescine aminotransferase
MHWAEANAEITRAVGDYYEQCLREWAARQHGIVTGIHGSRHLLGIEFADINQSKDFVRQLKAHGLDISVQTYKTDCPPVALTKLPIIADYKVVDWLMNFMETVSCGS